MFADYTYKIARRDSKKLIIIISFRICGGDQDKCEKAAENQ